MNRVFTILLGVTIVLVGLTMPASAQLTDKEWLGVENRNWLNDNNWQGGSRPTASNRAIIPANAARMPLIDNDTTDAVAGAITIEAGAKINVEEGATLILGDGNAQTTTLDGELFLGRSGHEHGVLKINGDHTIQGEGGVIHMIHYDSTKIIENDGTGDELTLQSSNTSCSGWPQDRDCTVVLRGGGEIHVALDNRAYVVGDLDCLRLKDEPKTGSSAGFWVVENDTEFHVMTTVTGACAWQCIDTTAPLGGTFKIEYGEGCVAATGPVTLYAGTLECGASFCTAGKLTLKSVACDDCVDDKSEPRIIAHVSVSTTFGLGTASPGCASCP
ncbi:MAG: hypothetical protein KJ057_06420 [Phycisphaerae bacterium]|nr:MAG: hypothetical protein F9K17_10590 [Phycisphaerae bacterium]MCK6463882.1 hypothetical protein [Phycisphaerae bacterium]MCL4718094.1 hypothetical protein [Phycisphaerae bacterium]MCQ3921037.1 hypothetical protein [Planctomycetota bacterium]